MNRSNSRLLGIAGAAALATLIAGEGQISEQTRAPNIEAVPAFIPDIVDKPAEGIRSRVRKAAERTVEIEPPDDAEAAEFLLVNTMMYLQQMPNHSSIDAFRVLDEQNFSELKKMQEQGIFYTERDSDACGNKFINIVRGFYDIFATISADPSNGTVRVVFRDEQRWHAPPWSSREAPIRTEIIVSEIEPYQIADVLNLYIELHRRYNARFRQLVASIDRTAGANGIEFESSEDELLASEMQELRKQFVLDATRLFGGHWQIGGEQPQCKRRKLIIDLGDE